MPTNAVILNIRLTVDLSFFTSYRDRTVSTQSFDFTFLKFIRSALVFRYLKLKVLMCS